MAVLLWNTHREGCVRKSFCTNHIPLGGIWQAWDSTGAEAAWCLYGWYRPGSRSGFGVHASCRGCHVPGTDHAICRFAVRADLIRPHTASGQSQFCRICCPPAGVFAHHLCLDPGSTGIRPRQQLAHASFVTMVTLKGADRQGPPLLCAVTVRALLIATSVGRRCPPHRIARESRPAAPGRLVTMAGSPCSRR